MNRLSEAELADLTARLEAALADRPLTLRPVAVGCSHDVYCAEAGDGTRFFVKVVEARGLPETERTLAFLRCAGASPLLPAPLLQEPLAWGGRFVSVFSWQEGRVVFPERLTDAQRASLLVAYREAAALFARSDRVAPPRDLAALYATVADFAARHPLVRPLLRPLLDIPAEERTYGPLAVIHGDFQYRNYGFTGERVTALFDFDSLMRGSPAEDLVYTVAGRYARSGATRRDRARLSSLLKEMVAFFGFPPLEWRRALAVCRLRVAAKRLSKHPRNPLLAFDVARRDRPFRRLAAMFQVKGER